MTCIDDVVKTTTEDHRSTIYLQMLRDTSEFRLDDPEVPLFQAAPLC